MTKTAVNRPVTTVMCVLIVFLAGIFAYSSLELAYMPSVDLPVALVSTTYSGTGPEEMEDLVTKPIEQTMGYTYWCRYHYITIFNRFINGSCTVRRWYRY